MRDGIGKLKDFHQRAFRKYLEHGVAIKRLNPASWNTISESWARRWTLRRS